MRRITINAYIVADATICHGKPTFRGTRIMVWQILEMLAAGDSVRQILKAFPSLTSKHVEAALDYASSLTKDSYVVLSTQPAFSP